MRKLAITGYILLLLATYTFAAKAPFNNGVNLTNWFQVGSAEQIQFSKYSKQDFENIQNLGCDVVRLPINLHFMTDGAPNYTLSPLFLNFLDEVVGWTTELDMHLILDNHTFDSSSNTDPNVGDVLLKVWPQMAEHYKDAYDKLYYEVLNEPHGISDALWNSTQQGVVAAIREIDTKHTIIVGPAEWNSYNNLDDMPVYEDNNLIYTFHFYDPFIFTHQGASWTDMDDLKDIPFPYDENRMPGFPASMEGHWSKNDYNNYDKIGTIKEVQKLIDIAADFAEERGVSVFCGEFGVYDYSSPDADRTYWYKVVREYLESKNIAWTIWDYHGGFGLYNQTGRMFEHDLNVPLCEALGFTAPEQTPFVAQPDSTGFNIFSDFVGPNINNSSYSDGELSFYGTHQPNGGEYCIQWSGASQYQSIEFDFDPNKDLSLLAEEGYALSMAIRGSDPNGSIDIRFVDSKTGEDDHPWRNRIIADKNLLEWNGEWEKIYVPLSDFEEHGSWDNEWYNPAGLFDWTAVDKLQIVTESKGMNSGHIFQIDQITISNQDTLQLKDYTAIDELSKTQTYAFYNSSLGCIQLRTSSPNEVMYQLMDISGRLLKKGIFENEKSIQVASYKKGVYLIQFSSGRQSQVNRINLY